MTVAERIKRRLFVHYKETRWQRFSPLRQYGQMLFVLGCQRSGTTLFENILDNDHRCIVFREDSQLTGHGHRLRLKPYCDLKPLLDRLRAPLIVAKPLVESQRATELLGSFPRSKAVWMLRDYRAVIRSHLRKFKGQHEYLRRVLEQPEDWRGERVSDHVAAIVRRFYRPDMSRTDAAGLIWYARNQLFFDQGLEKNPKVLVLRYENLVQDTDVALSEVSAFLDFDSPIKTQTGLVHTRSLAPQDTDGLSREIEEHCESLLARLTSLAETDHRLVHGKLIGAALSSDG